jgi:hypothetical protein
MQPFSMKYLRRSLGDCVVDLQRECAAKAAKLRRRYFLPFSPFSLGEKVPVGRMRAALSRSAPSNRNPIAISPRSPHSSPLPEGEGILSEIPAAQFVMFSSKYVCCEFATRMGSKSAKTAPQVFSKKENPSPLGRRCPQGG